MILYTDYGRLIKPFSIEIQNVFGFELGQTNWAKKLWDIWSILSPFWYSESLVHVFHYSTKYHLTSISKKKLSLYIHIQKYLFGIGVWIWAAKNEVFNLCVSVVRYVVDCFAFYTGLSTFYLQSYKSRLKNYQEHHYFWSRIGVNSVSLAICYPKFLNWSPNKG